MNREQEARDSFLQSVERARDFTDLAFCNFDDGIGASNWRSQVDTLLIKAVVLVPQRGKDEERRKLREKLVHAAGAIWRAARELGVEDEIPF